MGDKVVIKRDGSSQLLSIEKIRVRLERLLEGLATKHINLTLIINKTVSYAQNGNDYVILNLMLGIKTTELDNLMAETAAYLNILHPDFGKLGSRIAVTKLHKETSELFMDSINSLFFYTEASGKTYHY